MLKMAGEKELTPDNGKLIGQAPTSVFPYLENVSKDEAISRMVKIYITKVKITVGKKTKNSKAMYDIIVGGSDVL